MFSEFIMDLMGWADIWYAHPGPRSLFPTRKIFPKRWHVGVWTGPDNDLLCVRYCNNIRDAEVSLSPPARTILGAIIAALVLRYLTQDSATVF